MLTQHVSISLPIQPILIVVLCSFPKMDCLRALVSIHKPDTIHLWLYPDITAAEISLLGYSAARLDRHRHSSGIILFVADIYNVKVLQQGRSS